MDILQTYVVRVGVEYVSKDDKLRFVRRVKITTVICIIYVIPGQVEITLEFTSKMCINKNKNNYVILLILSTIYISHNSLIILL